MMKITACPKCGSRNIFQGTVGDGVLAGYTTKDVCKDCGYQGSPIIFDTKEDYEKFHQEFENKIKRGKGSKIEKKKASIKNKKINQIELSKKEKEVIDFLNEKEVKSINKESKEKQIVNHSKNWLPEILLAMILSAISIVITYRPFFSSIMDSTSLLIYSILLFVVLLFTYLFGIVVIEYFIKSMKKQLKNNKFK